MKNTIKKPEILVIDDDNVSIQIIKNSLEEFGFDIIAFNDSVEGYNYLIQNPDKCECLILDLVMPEMDGFNFIESLNKNYPKIIIPIIISSANQDLESIKKTLDLGAYDYFIKPLTDDDLKIMLPKKVKNAVHFTRMQKEIIIQNEKMKRDLSLANQFILKMLPSKSNYKYNFYYRYLPYNEIGGDFIDFIEKDDGFIFFIADVSGHGASAALISSFLKVEFQRYFNSQKDIQKFINYLNAEFINNFGDTYFCTLFIATFSKENRELNYVNAGHPPPILCIEGKPIFLNTTGSLVGVIEHSFFYSKSLKLKENANLICYTDGMYEFWLDEKDEIFGLQRLLKVICNIYNDLNKKNSFSIEKLVENCFNYLNYYSKGEFGDDLLMFVINL